ncbi:uncharacterized protein LOC141713189 [Apium graveolens]|uniref:uncharacterized protein LOC141713189 n=1 Tax=Apium graveolens TaxID=4045 RepID=UPI003D7B6CDD
MNAIGWNCRGVGSSRIVRVLKELVKAHKPDLLFLSETKVDSNKVATLAPKLGFLNFYSVDKHGQGGGLEVFWNNKINCTIFSDSQNHVDIRIQERNGVDWRLTYFYGFPERERRQASWDFIRHLASVDKKGNHDHPNYLREGFRKAVEDSFLTEVDLKGGSFTWEKSKGTTRWVRERLDRYFANENWWNKFPLCTLTIFHTILSDHDPIKLQLMNTSIHKKQFRFRFENMWLKEPNFHSEVSNLWQQLPSLHLLPKLVELSKHMAQWGTDFFHKFREKLAKQKKVVDDLKDREDDGGIQMYFEEKDKLDEILKHEEAYWQQRAKKFWLKDADTNSKKFHAAASNRKKLNHISSLKSEDGEVVTSHEGKCKLLKEYFSHVFKESNRGELSMHPDKASGPDGLNPAFFQQFWKMVGMEVFRCCCDWLKDGAITEGVNDTTLVLIPKKDKVEDRRDLRPIALCHVLYKIVAKRKNGGQDGEVALKLDISKAYDRVNWDYLRYRMQSMSFSGKWIKWKSAIFSSSNVRRDKQEAIKNEIGVYKDIGKSKYLGLPSLVYRSKKKVFNYLKEKIIQKIESWDSKLLSRAGKLVLLKNVVQSIPAYAMSCFLMPKSLCQEIHRVMNSFWWQSKAAIRKGIRWLGWNKMCTSKNDGGLGFRDIFGFNIALLSKQYWKLIHEPLSLLARMLKAKYYLNTSFLQADRKGGASYTWSGIWEAKEEMKKGLRWVVGDGKSIRVVHDRWLRTKNDYCFNINEVRGDASFLKVCDLFRKNKKEWDLSKLNSYFSSEDVEAILKIRIPQSFAKECWLKLGINVDSWDIEISREWLLQKLATGCKEETLKIVTVLWGV